MADTTYATLAQLRAALSNDETLTPERGQELLNQVALRVDAALRAADYTTVPATDTDDISLIRPYVANMAAAMAHRELYHDDEDPARVTAWETQFNQFLADLVSGDISLPGQSATPASSSSELSTGTLRFKRGTTVTEWS